MPPNRVFTEEEVKAIIRRASVRQEEEAERHEARQHGLTLADLEQLGAEVGLDPKHLRAAADEVRTGHRTAVQAETQTATHVIVEHWIDRPFSDEAWEDTVALLRSRFGLDMGTWYGSSSGGRVEQVGRVHEWSHMSQWGTETRVSVSERGGKTRLLLSQRVGYASPKVEGVGYGALFGLVAWLAGLMAGSMLGGSELFLFLLVATVILTAVVVAPRLEQKRRDKKQRGLKTLAADIEEVFAAAAPQADSVAATATRREVEETAIPPRLGLDMGPEEAGEGHSPIRNRTRS